LKHGYCYLESKNNKSFRIVFSFAACTSVKAVALASMFESLEKAIQQREKVLQSKDLYYQSEEHEQFYSICKGIWEYLLNDHEAQHRYLAKQTHGRCCWNHLIGLPEKHGVKHNLYMYEYNLFQELMKEKPKPTDNIVKRQQHKHLAIIKATGLGITEFVLRWIAWMCVRNDDLKGQRVCLVTGPNIALAITLIKRLKELFMNPESQHHQQLLFDTKENGACDQWLSNSSPPMFCTLPIKMY
jgi:primosomal protein N'